MHVRVTTRRQGEKVYRSVQLVKSFRRDDGMPANRVLASFGNLSELETANLKCAIAASRNGDAVVLASRESPPPRVKANLSYLDVAVCLRTWRSWRLSELIDGLVGGKHEVSVGEVIAALSIQRCVAPASKLEASRWFPRTALPELLAVAPARFNNTRVHRALEALDTIEVPLQQQLAQRIESQQGQFVCLFLDCSDTWFVGRGPELAHIRVTKEGLLRKRIGIALLCDQHGFPLRWATLAGNHHEPETMLGVIDGVAALPWCKQTPLVVDRVMGQGVTIEGLLARDVRFITAIPAPEIASYSSRIPLGAFGDVPLEETTEATDVAQSLMHADALAAGFKKDGGRYVFDLGVFTKGEGGKPAIASWLAPSRAKAALAMALKARSEVAAGATHAQLAERYDCSDRILRTWLALTGLTSELQKRVHEGAADRIVVTTLCRIARMPESQQQHAFEAACASTAGSAPRLVNRDLARLSEVPPLRVRAAVIFSPDQFLLQRRAEARRQLAMQALVDDINRRLQSPRSQRTREAAAGKATETLRRRELGDLYSIKVVDVTQADGRVVPQLELVRDEACWLRRRRTDGISLIVANPDVTGSPAQLASTYFAKDMVEKDFQAIKSVLALRPVNHQTDPKVRAHVSLCMLALLLERTIEKRLRGAGHTMTAANALHLLRTGHLNVYGTKPAVYSATEPNREQARILAALGLTELADDTALARQLKPR